MRWRGRHSGGRLAGAGRARRTASATALLPSPLVHDTPYPTEQSEAFGPWLGRQLRRAGMTQADLADRAGVPRATVSAWITGRAEPRAETEATIATILATASPK
ncbi:helix-turn-helix transcriptional regulator [Streptomyces massasporeus]|uniref:helix-turn-helix transcriptional regulator n=1 Tax=Streptomyces massasporeus TaxID=67324 RepID=UPI0033C7C47D